MAKAETSQPLLSSMETSEARLVSSASTTTIFSLAFSMNVHCFREFANPAPGANRHSESGSSPLHRTIPAALDTILREFRASLIGMVWYAVQRRRPEVWKSPRWNSPGKKC